MVGPPNQSLDAGQSSWRRGKQLQLLQQRLLLSGNVVFECIKQSEAAFCAVLLVKTLSSPSTILQLHFCSYFCMQSCPTLLGCHTSSPNHVMFVHDNQPEHALDQLQLQIQWLLHIASPGFLSEGL